VIWNAHVAEMTDLDTPQRAHLMGLVFTVETIVREELRPDKVNLASLGNVVPHLHWHIVPRFRDDPHFPEPIWGTRRRPSRLCTVAGIQERIAQRLVDWHSRDSVQGKT
jgi:diadenosine tetraphosphate (Ap4A) HIT family hydrolase